MNKFRASFTVLNKWASGDWNGAVETYFKLREVLTPAMEEGIRFHQEWEKEVSETGKLPAVFGDVPLAKPQTELKIEKDLADWLELVGVIDLYDEGTIYDFKTGKTPSSTYVNGFQPKVYQILMPSAKVAKVYHYDQYRDDVDMSMVHLTDNTLKEAVEWVVTLSSEMHAYFLENDLYEKYG